MITEKEIKEKYKQICNLLSERKLKPAFDLLDQLISESGLGEFQDEFVSLEQNYKFMLKYTVEGINDPERQKIYAHLLISTFELADRTFENLRMKYSQSVEYQKKRGFAKYYITNFEGFSHDLEKYSIQKELRTLFADTSPGIGDTQIDIELHFQKIFTLFYHSWFTNRLQENEITFLQSFLKNEAYPFYEKSIIVTGLTLSLMRFFDENKIILLFNAYEGLDEEISQRALIGLLIGLSLIHI